MHTLGTTFSYLTVCVSLATMVFWKAVAKYTIFIIQMKVFHKLQYIVLTNLSNQRICVLIYRVIISHPSFPVVFLYHMELLLIAVLVKPRIHNIRYYWYKWRHLFVSTWISYAIMKTRNIEVKCKFYKVVMTYVLKSFQPHIYFHKHDCNVYLNHNKERMYSSSYWNTAAHDTVALTLSYPCGTDHAH